MRIPNSTEWRSVPIDSIKPYGRTLRRHDRRKIKKITGLLKHYGQIAPIIVDADGIIIDGTSVWQAMRDMGASEIAVVTIASRNPADTKALRLALNRIAEDVAWDKPALKAEIEELVTLSFDLELTAFDVAEIDAVLDVDIPTANVVEDGADIPKVGAVPVSILGDIWVCGAHRLGCGSAHDADFVTKVAENTAADVVFIDPPYNVPIAGFVSGKGKAEHREFVAGVGELSSEELTAFLGASLDVLKGSCTQNALIYACMDWRHIAELLAAGKNSGFALYNLCVWTKTNAGMGSLYRNQHELVAVFNNGKDAPANNVELGRHGRNRSNVWSYRGFNSFGAERDELLAAHPTVKPVALVADVLRDVTVRGGAVLDTFMGSGTTLIAAEETGRRCFGTELDPLYVDVAIRRWQAKTKRDVVHAVTGELFDACAERLVAGADADSRTIQEPPPMSNDEEEDVGYKCPPKHSQFKKGQTGNPKGRPKNARNFKTDLKEELSQLIVVRENGRERKISKMRALLKVIVNAAVHGDLRAAQTVVTFSTKYLGSDEAAAPATDTAEDQDIIDAFVDRELTRRRTSKAPRPAKTKNEDSSDKT